LRDLERIQRDNQKSVDKTKAGLDALHAKVKAFEKKTRNSN
jgi:hypothetical protein